MSRFTGITMEEIVSDRVLDAGAEMYETTVRNWKAMDARPSLYDFAQAVSEHFAALMADKPMLRDLGSEG